MSRLSDLQARFDGPIPAAERRAAMEADARESREREQARKDALGELRASEERGEEEAA